MNDIQFHILDRKLDLISRTLKLNLVKGMDERDQIIMLNRFGLREMEIASILGSSRNMVHGIVHYEEKKKGNGT
jgi:hypothetical protein